MARIVFAGSPDFAVPALEQMLASGHEVIAVLTQPDRPSGRGRKLTPGPVKVCAEKHDVPVFQPQTLKDAEVQAHISVWAPDILIVVAYGQILPARILELPAHGCINVHASVLPRWRGASPIQTAILSGDQETGVSIMRMEEGLDTGPVYAMESTAINVHETAGELHDRLAAMGAALLGQTIDPIIAGTLTAAEQNDAEATYAPRLQKTDAVIDWSRPAATIDRSIRAYNPWPVAETIYEGQRMRCWRARVVKTAINNDSQPGTIIDASAAGLDIQTGDDVLRITELQLPGRQRISAADFVNSTSVKGKVLGQ